MAVSARPIRSDTSTLALLQEFSTSPSSLPKGRLREEARETAPASVASTAKTPNLTSTKYVPLRPKPVPKVRTPLPQKSRRPLKVLQSRKTDNNRFKLRTGCRVKCCQMPHCRLRTHRQYGQLSRTTSDSGLCTENIDPNCAESKLTPENEPLPAQRVSILQGGVDGLPALPLDGLEGSVFRKLFHDFFSYQYDKIRRIMCPPPISNAQKRAAAQTKHQTLLLALSSPIYCLNYIAATHHQVVFQRTSGRPDQITTLLYGKLTALLRAKLSSYDRSETPHIIKVILTLVMFEITHGRIQSLSLHRKAVKKIIDSHGGLHNMGDSIPMIQVLDRIFCIMLCSPTLHLRAPNQLVRKPPAFPPSYGSYLEDPLSKKALGYQIHEFCADTCRMIEIIEGEDWSFDPKDPVLTESSNSHYFFFLRECCAYRFVQLNASMANDHTIARCVLLAAKIVEYKVCHDDYFVAFPIAIANRIQTILCPSDMMLSWTSDAGILNWILFVLLCVSHSWEGRPWAMDMLKQQLDQRYALFPWPDSWRQIELDNIHHFVWSDTRLNSMFLTTCSELLSYANKDDCIRKMQHETCLESPVTQSHANERMVTE